MSGVRLSPEERKHYLILVAAAAVKERALSSLFCDSIEDESKEDRDCRVHMAGLFFKFISGDDSLSEAQRGLVEDLLDAHLRNMVDDLGELDEKEEKKSLGGVYEKGGNVES